MRAVHNGIRRLFKVVPHHFGWVFWLQWLLVSLAWPFGFLLAVVVYAVLAEVFSGPDPGGWALVAPAAVIAGGMLLSHWLGLRRQGHRAWIARRWLQRLAVWVLGSGAGGVLAGLVGMASGWHWGFLPTFAVAGALLGLGQWTVLRRFFARWGWWLLAGPVGVATGMTVGVAAAFAVVQECRGWLCFEDAERGFWSILVGWPVSAAVTGVMLWLGQEAELVCPDCPQENPSRVTSCIACGSRLQEVGGAGPSLGARIGIGAGVPGVLIALAFLVPAAVTAIGAGGAPGPSPQPAVAPTPSPAPTIAPSPSPGAVAEVSPPATVAPTLTPRPDRPTTPALTPAPSPTPRRLTPTPAATPAPTAAPLPAPPPTPETRQSSNSKLHGIVVDHQGYVYLANTGSHQVRKFTSDGTFQGEWGSEGQGSGQFSFPSGIAVDGEGDIYVADSGNHRIQKFTSSGTFLAQWGSEGTGPGQFISPGGIAVDGEDNVYVADTGNHRVQKFSAAGEFLAMWGSNGGDPGQFDSLEGIAVTRAGRVYVADTGNGRVQEFNDRGDLLAWWDPQGTVANRPVGLAVEEGGTVYLADPVNRQVLVIDDQGDDVLVRRWDSFPSPLGIAVDRERGVYVVEGATDQLQKFSSTGKLLTRWFFEPPQREVEFWNPLGVAVGRDGRTYVADAGKSLVLVLNHLGELEDTWAVRPAPLGVAVDNGGNVYLHLGQRVEKYSPQGELLTTMRITNLPVNAVPHGIAVGRDGNVYVTTHHIESETQYRIGRNEVWKFGPGGQLLSRWGDATFPSSQPGFPALRGLAVDAQGDVYVTDYEHNHVLKLNSSGTLLQVWPASPPDIRFNPPPRTIISSPSGIAVDPVGNVYVAETGGDRVQVFNAWGGWSLRSWKWDVTTQGSSGGPTGIAVDGKGNVFVTDTRDDRLHVFGP